MAYPELFLLRHGETEWNSIGRLHGQKNSSLTNFGKEQAFGQAEFIKELSLSSDTLIYSSPLGRSIETAKIISTHCRLDVRVDDNLSEVMMGEWQGLTWLEIETSYSDIISTSINRFDASLMAPEGEGYGALLVRAKSFLGNINKPSIIVSHGVLLSVIRGVLCNLSYVKTCKLQQTQGVVFHYKNGEERALNL
ncbi:MAG: broad specificity phosphatase PhoE [Paracoccaceae bacterium]|jgi:broad specificity phosphatase PhoE